MEFVEHVSMRLYGLWRLVSYAVKVVGETGPPREVFGPDPLGRLVLTPEHTLAGYACAAARRRRADDAGPAVLRAAIAYTGWFRVDGDRLVITLDGWSKEEMRWHEQFRYFEIDGDRLTLRTLARPSVALPGKTVVATAVWEREFELRTRRPAVGCLEWRTSPSSGGLH